MKTIYSFKSLAVVCVCLVATATYAQNIVNDTLAVSTNAAAEIVFPSSPNGRLSTSDGSYEVGKGTKKSLLIKANKTNAAPQTLTVDEASRKHRFVLLYNESASASRYDWSRQKDLERHVKEKKASVAASLAAADALVDKGDFETALTQYTRLQYDFEEGEREPVLAKIAECGKRLQEKTQKSYKEAMAEANAFINEKKFKEAIASCKKALDARPDDVEANKLMQTAKSLGFKDYTAKASEAAKDEKYSLAKYYFENAQKIDNKAFQQCCKDKYEGTLRKLASESIDVHDWVTAQEACNTMLAMKPDDKVCLQISEKIKEALAKEKDAKQREAEYYAILSKAKKMELAAATSKEYEAVIEEYNRAAKLFDNKRQFPKNRIEALKQKGTASAKH